MALVPCQVLRVAILLSYCSILCNYKAIEMPSHQTYGGSWKFLTFIDLRFSYSAPGTLTALAPCGFAWPTLIPIRSVYVPCDWGTEHDWKKLQVIQAVFFGICVLTDLSSLLTRGTGSQEQERQLKKLISLRDWMLAVLAFPVGIFKYSILVLAAQKQQVCAEEQLATGPGQRRSFFTTVGRFSIT
ncbi:hypothetical protein DBR06_SOUSAS510135 [Sousa chinensis]|nr:hypothetical protein DBR06_SOUSAS510135 [Sousa chinensis]